MSRDSKPMTGDERVMQLVESALSQRPEQRERYLREACDADAALFDEVWHAVQWEERMNGFMLDPVVVRPAGDDAPFNPGDIVENRFVINGEVARGGMGIVYDAHDRKLERRIALKCAKPAHHQHLAREVRNASEVSHPNVCKLYEIHTASTPAGDIDFITMEFLEGETLAARLKRGVPLAKQQADAIARQICAGVAEAHRNGVIHGDLKTGNVILTPAAAHGSERAVITDFGLAYGATARPGSIFDAQLGGTPAYMAPELKRGEKGTVASDIYAVGVLLRELFAGVKHDKWERIATRCVDPDPARRFASVDDILRAVGPSQTRRLAIAGIAAAVIAAATGLITYERATAPKTTVRLALGEFTGEGGDALRQQIRAHIAQIKSSRATRFVLADSSPTHVLHGSLKPDPAGALVLHALITDSRTGLDIKDWTAIYKPPELAYAPGALNGVVTAAFELPPTGTNTVNERARRDYAEGLKLVGLPSKVDAALEAMDRAVRADPDSALARAGLAEAQWSKFLETRDKSWMTRAKESSRHADLRDPDSAAAYRIAGLLKVFDSRYEEAEPRYHRAIRLDPVNGDGHRRLGQLFMRTNRQTEALAELRLATEVDPTYFGNWQQLGSYFSRQSEFRKAVDCHKKAVELAPAEPEPHRVLGAAYQSLGMFAEAEAQFRQALAISPAPVTLHALGAVLINEGRGSEAVEYIQRAIDQAPDRYHYWLNSSIAFSMAGKPSEARQSALRALDLAETAMQANPRDGYVRTVIALLLARLGDTKRALSEVVQARQLAPKDGDVQFIAALTYETLGRRDDTLSLLGSSRPEVIADLNRWPEVADLRRDLRFQQLLAVNRSNEERQK